MRIAMISWEALYGCPIGAVGVHVHELGRELVRLGQEVHLFTRMAPGQNAADLIEGIRYHRVPAEPRANFPEEVRAWNRSVAHYVRSAQRQHGTFHILHAHDWLALYAGLELAQSEDKRLIVTYHTTEAGRAGRRPTEGEALKIAELERRGVRESGGVIATTYATLRRLRTEYDLADWRTQLIYNGVRTGRFDTEPFDPGMMKQTTGIPPMDPVALFVGRLTFAKGPDLLLEALAQVKGELPALKAVLAGDGEMRGHLGKEANRLGIGHMVRFVGWKQGAELIDLYRACDFVVCPSRVDPFGMVPVTAWAARKPVLITRGGVPEEYVLDGVNGHIVSPDPAGVAGGLRSMLKDFDQLRWMGQNGRSAVEEAFLWSHAAERTISLYRNEGQEKYGNG